MKARTRIEKEVDALRATLPDITDAQRRYATENDGVHQGFFCKGEVFCAACASVFPKDGTSELIVSTIGDDVVCPHCGRRLKLEVSRRKKWEDRWYYTIITTKAGWQVLRHCLVEYSVKAEKWVDIQVHEVVQHWINSKGKEVIVARRCKPMSWACDVWDVCSEMEIRSRLGVRSGWSYDNGQKYDINPWIVYPGRRVIPILRRNGFTGRMLGIAPNDLCKMLLSDNCDAEMLLKTKQLSVLRMMYARGNYRLPEDIRTAICIANRNGMIVKDAEIWWDYIGLLQYFGKDIHSAHYVCAKNVKRLHDELVKKKEKHEAMLVEKERLRKMAEAEKQYKLEKGKYFGVCFGADGIVVHVIQSVQEMYDEGKAMHHCVYNAEYYKKNCLILSACDEAGKRMETIELSLGSWKVVQSRAVCNGQHERHDDIIRLVNNNINQFRRIA